jgi:ATP-dependent RNA helicase SUPV3L1/SUV3
MPAAADGDAIPGLVEASATELDAGALGTAPVAPESVAPEPAAGGTADTVSGDDSQASAAATEAPAASEADQPAAEPEMIDVWRAGRSEERRPHRADAQRPPQRPRHRREPVRTPQAVVAPDVAASSEAATLPAASDTAATRVDAPRRDRDGPRGQRPKREDERGARTFSKGPARDKDRPRDRDRPRRDERGDRSKGPEWKTHLPRERRDSAPDPNSPFAKLLALKEQLEADAKERR